MKKLIVLWMLLPLLVSAQKTVSEETQLWLGGFSQIRYNDRWGLWFDGHFRLRDHFVEKPSVGIARLGLTYYLYDDVRLTAGYAYVNHFPNEGHENVSRPEHRPWQQIQWFSKFPRLRIMQWVRLEERFRRNIKNDNELAEGYQFNYRVRFNVIFFVPITKKTFAPGGLQLAVNNEVHVNFGNNITYNYFDQNRFFTGLVYQITDHSQLQGGYMHVYQQLAAGNEFKSLNCIRLFYFHNFDLRKPKS